MTHRYKVNPKDKQPGMSGKVENDTNKMGNERPTQFNEGRRTARSRSDREDHVGNNQAKVRRGTTQGTVSQQPPMRSARGKGQRGM